MKPLFSMGDRVYYRENGPEDTGIVTGINELSFYGIPTFKYIIKWDNGDAEDTYSASQLGRIL